MFVSRISRMIYNSTAPSGWLNQLHLSIPHTCNASWFSSTQVVKSGSAGRRTAFSHRSGIQHIPTQYGAIECSVWELTHSKVTNLQGFPTFASSCTAPDPEPLPTGLEPVDDSGRLLFAPAPSVRSRPKSERCRVGGLRSTPCGFQRFPHANPKPDRPLGQSLAWKTKKPLRQTPVEPHLFKDTHPKGVGVWLNGFIA